MDTNCSQIEDVLHFWFEELSPANWWQKDSALDDRIRERFSDLHEDAAAGKLESWRTSPEGCLAEILILDQFSRNIHRDTPAAFAQDDLAVARTREAIERGVDQSLDALQRSFLYMPLMHSEDLSDHELAVQLYEQPGLESNLDFEHQHKVIIERFGRYPHRNEILGRESTPEEIAFLEEPGSSF